MAITTAAQNTDDTLGGVPNLTKVPRDDLTQGPVSYISRFDRDLLGTATQLETPWEFLNSIKDYYSPVCKL